jgi:hypothetical protein
MEIMTNGLSNGVLLFWRLKRKRKKSEVEWDDQRSVQNSRLWFGTESSPYDPRYQTEDIGDNAMRASEYGIKI